MEKEKPPEVDKKAKAQNLGVPPVDKLTSCLESSFPKIEYQRARIGSGQLSAAAEC